MCSFCYLDKLLLSFLVDRGWISLAGGPYFFVFSVMVTSAEHAKYPLVLLFIPNKTQKKIASYLTI